MKVSAARDAADAFARFVFVVREGEAREVYEGECEWLATPFDPTDGDRPYIKTSYDSRTPGGHSIHGFLERRHLPRGVKVEPRPDPDRFTRPRRFARLRVILGETVVPLLAFAVTGYLAVIVGAFLGTTFLRPDMRGLAAVAFIVALFFASMLYLVIGIIPVLISTSPWRFVRFVMVTAGLLGAFAGAGWVIWLHGDPSRILLYR